MRIIAGRAGGRRLISPDTRETRPVTERAREAIFSMIGGAVEEAAVLDLYAGSGSFGLESLSRGAGEATFVENGHRALDALRRNVAAVGLGGNVVASTVAAFLDRSQGRFDLVFIDPPWSMSSPDLAEELVAVDEMLAPGGQLFLSRRRSDISPENPGHWAVAADRGYGDTRILRYQKEVDA
jgi:16S rRNA (guanine966-N2)-methyltransferase